MANMAVPPPLIDAEALLKIYEPYIATTVTNETQVPALGEFRQRIVDRDGA